MYYTKKITIIIPTFNSERTIKEAIQSVINQTFNDWELLVIDDCSNDLTIQIVESYQEKYSNIHLIKKRKNTGVSDSRNIGIEKSKTPFIAFLDSDDIWCSEKLSKQMLIMESGCDICYTGVKYIKSDGIPLPGIFEVPIDTNYNNLLRFNVISTSSVLLRRSIIDGSKMVSLDFHEDFHFWLTLLKKNCVCQGINEPLLVYRFSKKTKSSNKLKSFSMTYRVYREINLNPFTSVFFTISHLVNATLKYKKIFTL
ncbi:glycosyltransferase family 2 protein [Enterococcus casseliflavus]|uniref:glycosyltransferase family 2 protein n=1 Tax=Enterococcus casseliflavus TaxID=37734 RepID=UPI001BCA9DE4|nr:glycosyltransferase family 2 protein [Enterococcus casseliflavus]